MNATYTKLRSGEWGIRVQGGTVREGQTVTVRKQSGETKTETVKKVVFAGNGIQLCAIGSGAPAPSRSRSSYTPRSGRRRTGCACGSYEDEVNPGDCFTCRHDQE